MTNARWARAFLVGLFLPPAIAFAAPQEVSTPATSASQISAPVLSPEDSKKAEQPTTTGQPEAVSTTPKPLAAPKKKHRIAKRPAAPPSDGGPRKIVVREGGVDEPTAQIVTGINPAEAARERNEAQLVLQTTAEVLKEIAPRQLDTGQQETLSQIHNYMNVANSALREGDISRAHTLAEKAALLANDLARH